MSCKYFGNCEHQSGWCNSDTALIKCTYGLNNLCSEQDWKIVELEEENAELKRLLKHGKWRISKNCVLPTKRFVCSECNGLVIVSTYRNRCLYNYCPNCGAKMDLEEE